MIVLKISLIATLMMVCIQDIKEREVFWFFFPIIALCCGVLLYKNLLEGLFFYTILLNLSFVVTLLVIVFLYSKYKLKTTLKNTFGLGDALLFFALVLSFSTVSFLTLFVFSLIFSLVLHLLLKKHSKQKTVPLAGYMSLFFSMTYISHWLGYSTSIYTI